MKKLLLVVLATVGIATASQAQSTRFGIKAGASLTNFVGKDTDGLANKFGAHGGLFAELGVTDNFAIQPEVLFSMKGTQDEDDSDNKVNQSYIDIPVLFKVKADGLFFEAGPQLGILVGSKIKSGSASVDSKDLFKTVDFGYAAGLGYQFSSGPMLGLRYNGGITKIGETESANGITIEGPASRNSAFQFYVGFAFGGK